MENTVDKVIITVVGKDTVGIIAKVCTYLSENHINVLDISQTIVSGFFNMMMIVDMSQSSRSFGDCQKDLVNSQTAGCSLIQFLIQLFPAIIPVPPFLPEVFRTFCFLSYYENSLSLLF